MVMTIATEAVSFILAQEDGDQVYYEKTEEHWDWPGGASGPTIGVGYDCGYTTHDQCTADWKGIVDDITLLAIQHGVGRVGNSAHMFVMDNRRDVTVTWAQAVRQFTERELPKQEDMARKALPNWELLSPLSAGALVSLGYNRGWGGFHSTLPRFREMYAITAYMAQGRWPYIPTAMAQMVRLWPNVTQLRRRRALEAQMFARGLEDCKPLHQDPPVVA
jgi:GH24 family phage-related lysozyme (muramidase)